MLYAIEPPRRPQIAEKTCIQIHGGLKFYSGRLQRQFAIFGVVAFKACMIIAAATISIRPFGRHSFSVVFRTNDKKTVYIAEGEVNIFV
jgi:hypothetical protein